MTRPRLLDLFCGAGGAGTGYALAGFEVVGVDIAPQPRYPFEFHLADALTFPLEGFDAIHASPPCQHYTRLRSLPWLRDREYWESIPPTMARMAEASVPWVVENVNSTPARTALGGSSITLCGTQFGLAWPDGVPIYRHRVFASSEYLFMPEHRPHTVVLAHGRDRMDVRGGHVTGRRRAGTLNSGRIVGGHQAATTGATSPMGVDWMNGRESAQSIPPAYTEWIGAQLIRSLAP